MIRRLLIPLFIAALLRAAPAQVPSPAFNGVSGKTVPPPGIAISAADRQELEAGVVALGQEIESLRARLADQPLLALLPDVQIFHNAVRYPLAYDEFYKSGDVATARALLKEGNERARALLAGNAPWTTATGNVVRGYLSRIDGSAQPYGIVVPATWKSGDRQPRPLWLWQHGRSENLTELAFISSQMKAKPELAAGDAFFLRLYGRFCNASKFAGETDLFEAMENARQSYTVDPQRIVVAGFSMGGASCWHLATHYAGLWAAASPGAGFAETPVYAKVFAPGRERPPWWEQRLWHWYNATDYAGNLFNTSLIAYSGGDDPQKQSADIMETAMAAEGLKLERLIGPHTGHKYEPATKKELERRLDELAARGKPPLPPKVRFTTYTLRYNRMEWIQIDALQEHWQRADVAAELAPDGVVRLTTKNIAALSTILPAGTLRRVIIDGQEVADPRSLGRYRKTAGHWVVASVTKPVALEKHHGLTGPVDDAFMDSFIFVRPTGKPFNEKIGAWAASELERAIVEWRRVFRGEPRVKDDHSITAEDIANSNLVLWGDPSSNALLARVLPRLPVRWTARALEFGTQIYPGADHAPILIYPNPLNPNRYVVLNSSFTFREGSSQSNSLQTPKLPDWAVVDLRTPPGAKWPGGVAEAGFFGETWEFKIGVQGGE